MPAEQGELYEKRCPYKKRPLGHGHVNVKTGRRQPSTSISERPQKTPLLRIL